MRGIIECPMCGRSAGHVADGADYCGRCRVELDPSPLAAWRSALGWSVSDLEEATGIPVPTLQRALRGDSIGRRHAGTLARLTGIPVASLVAGHGASGRP